MYESSTNSRLLRKWDCEIDKTLWVTATTIQWTMRGVLLCKRILLLKAVLKDRYGCRQMERDEATMADPALHSKNQAQVMTEKEDHPFRSYSHPWKLPENQSISQNELYLREKLESMGRNIVFSNRRLKSYVSSVDEGVLDGTQRIKRLKTNPQTLKDHEEAIIATLQSFTMLSLVNEMESDKSLGVRRVHDTIICLFFYTRKRREVSWSCWNTLSKVTKYRLIWSML